MNHFTCIIVEYRVSTFLAAFKQIDFVDLGDLDWLEDREWAMQQAEKTRRDYEKKGHKVERVFLSELIQ